LNAQRPKEQGFSLAVVLVSMLAVLVSSVALANRTQTGLVTASVSGSNREAREVADAGITYVISEWNRPENRGMFNTLQPMTAWTITNNDLRNPCADSLQPTNSGTSNLTTTVSLDNNRRFVLAEVVYSNSEGTKSFTARPGDSTPPAGIELNDVEQVDVVVKGTYQRGSSITTAQATRRFNLAESFQCNNNSGTPKEGVFAYGGSTPGSTPSFDRTPQYYVQEESGILTRDVPEIFCSPIVTNQTTENCTRNEVSNGEARVPITRLPLSASEREKRNPPSIFEATGQTPPATAISARRGNDIITIRGTSIIGNAPESNSRTCVMFEGAAHCNISSINLTGGQELVVDTSTNPIYLYVSGNISLGGGSDIKHKINARDVAVTDFYSDIDQFNEDAFRFQIRGTKAGNTQQTFSFNGTPSANILYWAPAANLTAGGNTDLVSALFVNSLSLTGNSRLILISQPSPDSFPFNLGKSSETKRTVVARNSIFNKFF
jgi:hypothetical protein